MKSSRKIILIFVSIFIVGALVATYLVHRTTRVIESAAVEESPQETYNYRVESKEFGAIYIHGVIPEYTKNIDEEEAVKIANEKFLSEGFFDTIDLEIQLLEYHLNYMNINSSENTMWAVFAVIDGIYQYECLVSVDTGEISLCFPMSRE